MRNLVFVICLLLIPSVMFGQETRSASKYHPVRNSANFIINGTGGLGNFYQKLRKLEAGQLRKVTIAHIGDSHIQADIFSGEVRLNLHTRFGSAGRGLIMPYEVAQTNSPYDIKAASQNVWFAKRNVFPNEPLPIGISGITLSTIDTDFEMDISILPNEYKVDYAFDRVTLFTGNQDNHSGIRVKGQRSMSNMLIGDDRQPTACKMLRASLIEPTREITLEGYKRKPHHRQVQLYGLMLEKNGARGVLYNMIGVNGAKYTHYNQSKYFLMQLRQTRPDLIIISLGTNEAISKDYQPSNFQQSMRKLVSTIREKIPYADILLTTPPDVLRGRMFAMNEVKEVSNSIKSYAVANNLACWDFFTLMGGSGAMRDWYDNGWANDDRIHLNPTGYRKQGRLLYDALMQSYDSFLTGN